MVIVGGADSRNMEGIMRQKNVAVILSQPHSLHATDDDGVDQPDRTRGAMQKTGLFFNLAGMKAVATGSRSLTFPFKMEELWQ